MSIESLLFAASVFFFLAAGFFGLVFIAIFIRPRVFMGVSLPVSAVVFLLSPIDALIIFATLSIACLSCHCHRALANL
jgi:hypothetical protein